MCRPSSDSQPTVGGAFINSHVCPSPQGICGDPSTASPTPPNSYTAHVNLMRQPDGDVCSYMKCQHPCCIHEMTTPSCLNILPLRQITWLLLVKPGNFFFFWGGQLEHCLDWAWRDCVRVTHIVRQGCVVSLSTSQRLCCLLQNLVVLFGKQSKQTGEDTERGKEVWIWTSKEGRNESRNQSINNAVIYMPQLLK